MSLDYTLNIGRDGRQKDRACWLGDERVDIVKFPNIAAQMDAHHLAFKDNTFTQIYCFEVLEHLEAPVIALGEMGRVLESNGKVLLTIPNILYWRRIACALLKKIFVEPDHKQAWDILKLGSLAEQCGLSVEEYGWIN